jgi:hypothetical protein
MSGNARCSKKDQRSFSNENLLFFLTLIIVSIFLPPVNMAKKIKGVILGFFTPDFFRISP